jgi:hypothetical protein
VLVFGDQPGGVVGGLEGMESVQEVRHGGEAVDPQQLFFESPDEALRDSVALRFPNKRRRGVSGSIDREGNVTREWVPSQLSSLGVDRIPFTGDGLPWTGGPGTVGVAAVGD